MKTECSNQFFAADRHLVHRSPPGPRTAKESIVAASTVGVHPLWAERPCLDLLQACFKNKNLREICSAKSLASTSCGFVLSLKLAELRIYPPTWKIWHLPRPLVSFPLAQPPKIRKKYHKLQHESEFSVSGNLPFFSHYGLADFRGCAQGVGAFIFPLFPR